MSGYLLLDLFRFENKCVIPKILAPNLKNDLTVTYSTELEYGNRFYHFRILDKDAINIPDLLDFFSIYGIYQGTKVYNEFCEVIIKGRE